MIFCSYLIDVPAASVWPSLQTPDLGSRNRPFFPSDPRVDVSERGGPRLPDAGDRAAAGEPARLNCRRMRSLPRPNPLLPSGVGAQWELPGAAARRNLGRRRAFCPDGDLGSSNRPFPRRRPRSNGSAREPSRSNLAGRREAAL